MVSDTIKIEAEIQRERGIWWYWVLRLHEKKKRFCDARERNNKVSIVPTKTNIKD